MREKLNEEFEKIGVFSHINIVLHHLMMNVKHITIFNEKQQISKKAMKNQINQLLT